MVTTFYPPYHFGGDATYVRALARALVGRGHEVEVVHCEDAYRVVSRGRMPAGAAGDEQGITIHRLKSPLGMLSPLFTQQTGYPGFKRAALENILERDFDVVNFHNISLIGGPGVLKLSRAPVSLYTLHEHWLLCPTHIFWKYNRRVCDRQQCVRCSLRSGIPPQWWRYTGLLRSSLARVDTLFCPSEYTARRHREAGLHDDIRVLPLFSTLDPGEPPEYQPPPRPTFLYAGRVTESKGLVPLLAAFSRLPDVDLQIAGKGTLLARLQRDYGQCANIRFLGPVRQPELVQLYREATAVILPSLAPETFGLIVAESFACGTPAIVRDAGGSREQIEATGAGFVYHDDAELVEHVRRLGGDPALRRELGRRARDGFERLYSTQRHLDAYLGHIAGIRKRKGMAG